MRRLISLSATSFLSGIAHLFPVIDFSIQSKGLKGSGRISRNAQWKANLRMSNQKQNGLRSPNRRGK